MLAKTPQPSSRLPHTSEFKDTAAVLMMNAPFFASLFMRYKHIATDSIGTLAVGVRTFMYNPAFLKSLPPEGRLAAFAHEVLHGVFQHVPMQQEYFRSNIGPDGAAFRPDLWAQAIDYCVNANVKDARIGEVQKSWFCDPVRFPATMTPQEIYVALRQAQSGQGQPGQGQPGQGQPGGLGDGESLDQHGLAEDEDVLDGDGEPAITTGAVTGLP